MGDQAVAIRRLLAVRAGVEYLSPRNSMYSAVQPFMRVDDPDLVQRATP